MTILRKQFDLSFPLGSGGGGNPFLIIMIEEYMNLNVLKESVCFLFGQTDRHCGS